MKKRITIILLAMLILIALVIIVITNSNHNKNNSVLDVIHNTTKGINEKIYHPTKIQSNLVLKEEPEIGIYKDHKEYKFTFSKDTFIKRDYLRINYVIYSGDTFNEFFKSFVYKTHVARYNEVDVHIRTNNTNGFISACYAIENVIYKVETRGDIEELNDLITNMTSNVYEEFRDRKITYDELKAMFLEDTKDAPDYIYFPTKLPADLVLSNKPNKVNDTIYSYTIKFKDENMLLFFDHIYDEAKRELIAYEFSFENLILKKSNNIDVYITEQKDATRPNAASFVIDDMYYMVAVKDEIEALMEIVDSITKQDR